MNIMFQITIDLKQRKVMQVIKAKPLMIYITDHRNLTQNTVKYMK